MVSSISDILLKNNLNYPANLPANELNMYLYGLTGISPADNRSIILATIKFIPLSLAKRMFLTFSFTFCMYVLLYFF